MLAFEIHLNGKKVCTAGIGEAGVLTSIVTWVLHEGGGPPKGQEAVGVQVGGLISKTDKHVSWLQRRLRRGDEVSIRIVEADAVDRPKPGRRPESPAQRRRRQKAHVRAMAKEFGWKIETR